MYTTKKLTKKSDKDYMNEILEKLKEMKNSQFRTTNFSLIEYFVENNFKPLDEEELISKILDDFKANPNKYVLSNDIGSFKSEKSFKHSVRISISKNKAFQKGPKSWQLSLNLEKTFQYLKIMYDKYINNSLNINTPYKIFGDKNKYSKTNKKLPPKQESDEINNTDSNEMQVEDEKRKNQKSKNKNQIHYYDALFSRHNNDNIGFIENDKNSKNSFFYTPKSYSNLNNEEKKRDKSLERPDIFTKKLYPNSLASSFNKDNITNLINSLNNYLSDTKQKFEVSPIEQTVEKMVQSLQYLSDIQNLYNSQCYTIKNCQDEIYSYYKMMLKGLRIIKYETGLKSYNYESYAQLRELILTYGSRYNDMVELIKQKINELKDIEKEFLEKRIFIKNCINDINNTSGFNNINFSMLSNSIEQILKINNISFNEKIMDVDNDDKKCFDNIESIVNSFLIEKEEIIDEINGIDKFIGSISLEE